MNGEWVIKMKLYHIPERDKVPEIPLLPPCKSPGEARKALSCCFIKYPQAVVCAISAGRNSSEGVSVFHTEPTYHFMRNMDQIAICFFLALH